MNINTKQVQKLKFSVLVLIGALINTAVVFNAIALSLSAQVGKQLFHDANLSGSGQMSCNTCHDVNNHYGQPVDNKLAVMLGGVNLTSPGSRTSPSVAYKDNTPPYTDNAVNALGNSLDGPGGGMFWDGRSDTLAEQASGPLLNPVEMANASVESVVSKIQSAAYAGLFIEAFGANAFADTQTAFNNAMLAIQAFEVEDPSFHPYSSKFDYWINNQNGVALTASELNGYRVFIDPQRGNCNACHATGPNFNGSNNLFTDFSYVALGVPRNPNIPANKSVLGVPTNYDMGICRRSDHQPATSAQECGMFKTPTLRNVATRNVFFHNGVFTSLSQVLEFYNTRDTNPARWYPTVNGVVQKFNDLPSRYRGNIDMEVPINGRPVGGTPAMTAQELLDLEAFLNALTDGYVP